MINHLIDLFKDENTIILPGLGALTMTNRAKNELMFMSYLKHNDGTLVKFVAGAEGIEETDALDLIEQFVISIKAGVDTKGVFALNGLGEFYKTNDGDYDFRQPEDDQVIVAPTAVEPIKEEVVVAPIVVTPAPPPIEETKVEEPVFESIVEEEIVVKTPAVTDQVVEPDVEASSSPVNEPTMTSQEEQWNDDLDLPPLNYEPERPKKPILEKTKKDKKPRRWGTLIGILLAIIVIGGATYVGLNYKDLQGKFNTLIGKNTEPTKEDELTTELPEDEFTEVLNELVEEEQIEEEHLALEEQQLKQEAEQLKQEQADLAKEQAKKTKAEKQPAVTQSGGLVVDKSKKIQVIFGSFGEKENADRMVEKLTNQGLPAQIIGVYNGLHTVSGGSFDTMADFKANVSKFESAGTYWVKK